MSIGALSITTIIDLVILGILLIFVIAGTVRGLVESIVNVAGTIIALIAAALLAGLFAPPVTDWLYPHFQDRVLNKLNLEALGLGNLEGGATPLSGLFPTLSENIQSMVEAAAKSVFAGTARVILFLLLFIVCILIVKLISGLLERVFELPVLKSFNRLGGALFGLIEGMLIIYVIVFAAPRLGLHWLNDHAQGTILLNFFINVSPLEWLDFLKLKSLELITKKS